MSNQKPVKPDLELQELLDDIKNVSVKLKSKIEKIVNEDSDNKNFRKLVYDKEVSQLLTGYTQLQKLRLDVIKEFKDIKEKEEELNIFDLE